MPASGVPESALLTRARAREIFEAAASAAHRLGVRDLEAMIGAGTHALTRFANNTIHQNVAERSGYLSIRASTDQRTARASTNRLDAEGIRRVVEEAITLTRLQTPAPDLLPLASPAEFVEPPRSFGPAPAVTPTS